MGCYRPLPTPSVLWKEIATDLIVGPGKIRKGWDAIFAIARRLARMAQFVLATEGSTSDGIASILIREAIRLHVVSSAEVSAFHAWRFMCKKLAHPSENVYWIPSANR